MRISDWSSDVCSSDLPCCTITDNWHWQFSSQSKQILSCSETYASVGGTSAESNCRNRFVFQRVCEAIRRPLSRASSIAESTSLSISSFRTITGSCDDVTNSRAALMSCGTAQGDSSTAPTEKTLPA